MILKRFILGGLILIRMAFFEVTIYFNNTCILQFVILKIFLSPTIIERTTVEFLPPLPPLKIKSSCRVQPTCKTRIVTQNFLEGEGHKSKKSLKFSDLIDRKILISAKSNFTIT